MNRPTVRQRPQRLLITILGDYWRGRTDPIPSAALVKIMAEFDIRPEGTRSALSRLGRRGLLVRTKKGRRTYYGLTQRALRTLDEGAAHIFGFGTDQRPWDGQWTVVVFSVAERERAQRHVLRTRLRWLTFAPLYDAVWVSPHDEREAVAELLQELGIDHATILRAAVVNHSPGDDDLLGVWDLDSLRDAYESFLDAFTPLRDRVARGEVSPSEALVARTQVMDAWRAFPREDPDLPARFLPADWPRDAARQLFVEVYDALAPAAEARFKDLVTQDEDDITA
ncbi:MAG: PaaX family transcriptional regulator [Dehalococcoidia bacterium]